MRHHTSQLGIEMYENWICTRWDTPLSDTALLMESLTDGTNGLEIVVNASLYAEQPLRYSFFFRRPAGYRNLLEEYRTELWRKFAQTSRPGSTFVVENSPWIAEIAACEPLLHVSPSRCDPLCDRNR